MFSRIFKYDPNQPRHPKGAPGGKGGQFAPKEGVASKLFESSYRYVSSEELLNTVFTAEERALYNAKLKEVQDLIEDGKETYKVHSRNGDGTGGYTQERLKLHRQIIDEYISEGLAKAKPAPGEKPRFVVLGGRGGSGKSSFNQDVNPEIGVYSEKNVVKIDPDELKKRLADVDGRSLMYAALYHEESSKLAKRILSRARQHGLNVVLDVTMSKDQSNRIKAFKDAGYQTEGYYMFLPNHKAGERALLRASVGGTMTGRLVPSDVILKSVNNEKHFDRAIRLFDKWAVYSNDVPKGQNPKFVAGNIAKVARFLNDLYRSLGGRYARVQV